ncbi:MAG TPA: lipoyl synthase, partial [Candidatus Sumerlaeota bacterium]|nr:lipoyl synthase [Candidatus Sumerlaeota bacterium]
MEEKTSDCGGGKRPRLPGWLRRKHVVGANAEAVQKMLDELGLATVCSSAHCPNMAECFQRRTATFMILGDRCTRACRFCAVHTAAPEPVRADEPEAVAEACARLGLRHVVITSVTRDDLLDGGAGHFAAVCQAVRRRLPDSIIEILTPDFQGHRNDVETALSGGADIFNHNVETVPRLYATVRPQADYAQSLRVLEWGRQWARQRDARLHTKSGVMVGLGETRDELRQVFRDLHDAGCEILTIGQYLAPSPAHHPVVRFVEPSEFEEMEREAREL